MARQDYDHSPHTAVGGSDVHHDCEFCARRDDTTGSTDRFVVCTTFRHGAEPPFNLVDDFDAASLTAAIAGWLRDGYSVDIEYLYDC